MSDKFEISACYRKVFELLNKVSSVQELICKITDFTEIEIVITDIAGKILASSCDDSMTAKRLFIHRNTMIYCLSRVTEILGVDINNPVIANNLLISMILQETERRDS